MEDMNFVQKQFVSRLLGRDASQVPGLTRQDCVDLANGEHTECYGENGEYVRQFSLKTGDLVRDTGPWQIT